MYVDQMLIGKFRHLKDLELGPFREPAELSELIVLAGTNGGGKSSILELLSFGLTSRYSWQYYQSRQITEHSFAIRIGLTSGELDLLREDADDTLYESVRTQRGYWLQVNMPEAIPTEEQGTNERVHGLVSRRFTNFSKKLGFFVRSDRAYDARSYNKRELFNYKRRLQPNHFNSLSYVNTREQYADMYDFLVEQAYHYVYDLGRHHHKLNRHEASTAPTDPLTPYNELLDELFPGYRFDETFDDTLSLRVVLPTGNVIPFQDLSSGEKEVFFLLSMFVRHNLAQSVIVIDEPELHLHPELARRLVRTMRAIRPGNQIWCATHSAELIDEAGRDRTFFLKPTEDRTGVECFPATRDGAEVEVLRDMYGYSGYVGISKRILFTEGRESSADRKTFANLFPAASNDVRLIPSGSAQTLYGINRAVLALLESDFARCDFYLIRDRDYLSDERVDAHRNQAEGRLFVLERNQIENYLIDAEAIAAVLTRVYGKPTAAEAVETQLLEIATGLSATVLRDMTASRYGELFQAEDCGIGAHSENLAVVDQSGTEDETTVSPLKQALTDRVGVVAQAATDRTAAADVDAIFETCKGQVLHALSDGGWRTLFPGRAILKRFSALNGLGDWPALQNQLIDELARPERTVPAELREIFESIVGRELHDGETA